MSMGDTLRSILTRLVAYVAVVIAAGPVAAWAQQQMPVIGWLSGVSSAAGQPILAAFSKALGDAGYVEGRNVQIEYRWADGRYDQLPAMATDLAARTIALMVTGGGEAATFAAKAATSTIPIVMVVGSDPVKEGLVIKISLCVATWEAWRKESRTEHRSGSRR
jgi:putative tryptophan/tyrosine transport system substrate-binding protein